MSTVKLAKEIQRPTDEMKGKIASSPDEGPSGVSRQHRSSVLENKMALRALVNQHRGWRIPVTVHKSASWSGNVYLQCIEAQQET